MSAKPICLSAIVALLCCACSGESKPISPEPEPELPVESMGHWLEMGPIELEEVRARALAGDRDSAIRMANHYRETRLQSKVSDEEIYWLEKAVSLGDVSSMNVLATTLSGRRAPGDCAKAQDWAKQWRELGDLVEGDLADDGRSHLEASIANDCRDQ